MKNVNFTVNGQSIEAAVEPRTHLADFLREHCRLTGTVRMCARLVRGRDTGGNFDPIPPPDASDRLALARRGRAKREASVGSDSLWSDQFAIPAADGVLSMTNYHGSLVVAGYFTTLGDQSVSHVAIRTGSRWTDMGAGTAGLACC